MRVQTCSFLLDHQLIGMMRTFGIAASAAGEPARICADCTDNEGTERMSEERRGATFERFAADEGGLRFVYGILHSFSCVSTRVYATRALRSVSNEIIGIQISVNSPAV